MQCFIAGRLFIKLIFIKSTLVLTAYRFTASPKRAKQTVRKIVLFNRAGVKVPDDVLRALTVKNRPVAAEIDKER